MSEKGAIKKSTAQAICDAIKTKEGSIEPIPFNEVADRITALPTPSGENKFAQLIDGTLTEITAKDLEGVTEMRDYMFAYWKSIEKVVIPDEVFTIGQYVFYFCTSLRTIVLGKGVTTILRDAFDINPNSNSKEKKDVYYRGSLKDWFGIKLLNFQASPLYGATSDFYYMNDLNEYELLSDTLIIPDGITEIKNHTTYGMRVDNVIVPESVTKINDAGMRMGDPTRLVTYYMLGTTPPTIQKNSFYISGINKIIVPKGYGDVYKSATNWTDLADYIEEAAE